MNEEQEQHIQYQLDRCREWTTACDFLLKQIFELRRALREANKRIEDLAGPDMSSVKSEAMDE